MSRTLVAVGGFVGLTALLAPTVLHLSAALLWNATASAPIGLYWIHASRPLSVGDWVAARPPDVARTLFAERRYLPVGVPLVKQIAAVSPQRVCRFGVRVTIDRRAGAQALTRDRMGRALPVWSGCRRLQRDEFLLLNAAAASLDGRYFGPSSGGDIVGRLTPVWIVKGAAP